MPHDDRHKSRTLTEGPDRAPARAMLKAIGFTTEELARPLVAVAHTWTETMPCNFHLRSLAQRVKEGIRAAGATPMVLNSMGVAPAARMPSFTRCARLRRWKLHGIVSVQVCATATSGRASSSVVNPIAFSIARAGARSGPSVRVRLLCLSSCGMGSSGLLQRREDRVARLGCR